MRQVLSDPARRLDEIDAVIVVLFQAGGDREDVGIEDDVFRREADLIDQDVVGALADADTALQRIGLALLVEGHHHHRCAMPAHDLRVINESRLAFLQRDRIHHRLALDAFQPGFDDGEFRGVHHHRHLGDVRLGSDEMQEVDHRLLRIEQAFVHVDVDDLRAVVDLLARDIERGRRNRHW